MKRNLIATFPIFFALLSASISNAGNIDNESLNYLIESNNKVIFAALISINDSCRKIFPEYITYEPNELFGRLSNDDIKKIIETTKLHLEKLGDKDKSIFFKRIDRWILLQNQMQIFFKLKNEEETISAFYYIFPDESIFKTILKNRGVNPEDIDPEFLGATVSSAEMTHIQYEILNRLSLLADRELIEKLKSIFEYFAD
jgi:hypothetical protein